MVASNIRKRGLAQNITSSAEVWAEGGAVLQVVELPDGLGVPNLILHGARPSSPGRLQPPPDRSFVVLDLASRALLGRRQHETHLP